jgi:hypothetical protein
MCDSRPNLIIGFHGCEEAVKQKLINSSNSIQISNKPYDWLGHGMYFWENNHDRAMEWATEKQKRGEIDAPTVVGAVLQLGYCCDLLDSRYVKVLKNYYGLMADFYKAVGKDLPENKNLAHDIHRDKILRVLDCTVIEYMHNEIYEQYKEDIQLKGFSDLKTFESTRCVFTEGGPAYAGAGIFEKSHIQVCIRNPDCIKGFFNPRKSTPFNKWVEGKIG